MRPNCPKCDNDNTYLSYSFSTDCLKYLPDERLIVCYWCSKCKTEFQTIYIPGEKSIVSEEC